MEEVCAQAHVVLVDAPFVDHIGGNGDDTVSRVRPAKVADGRRWKSVAEVYWDGDEVLPLDGGDAPGWGVVGQGRGVVADVALLKAVRL